LCSCNNLYRHSYKLSHTSRLSIINCVSFFVNELIKVNSNNID